MLSAPTLGAFYGRLMRTAFHGRLDSLIETLSEMCGLAGLAMEQATHALLQADLNLAETVIADHERLAQLNAFLGRFEDAIAEDTKARLLSDEDQNSALQKEAALRHAWNTEGSQGYWKKLIEFTQMPENPPETYGSPSGTAMLMRNSGRRAKLWNISKRLTNNPRWR